MNTVHPTAVIGARVRLGSGNVVGPYVVIGGDTSLGDNNWIGAGSVLGAPPEIRSHAHPVDWIDTASDFGLVIGGDNVIREGVQISGGSVRPTTLGDNLFIMNQCYIAHDGTLLDGVTMASSVTLAGHVSVGRGANLGLGTSVHQGRVIGGFAMVGMGSVVTRDLPPFALAFGSPATVKGINRVGMSRADFDPADIDWAESPSSEPSSERVAAELDWFSRAANRD